MSQINLFSLQITQSQVFLYSNTKMNTGGLGKKRTCASTVLGGFQPCWREVANVLQWRDPTPAPATTPGPAPAPLWTMVRPLPASWLASLISSPQQNQHHHVKWKVLQLLLNYWFEAMRRSCLQLQRGISSHHLLPDGGAQHTLRSRLEENKTSNQNLIKPLQTPLPIFRKYKRQGRTH